MVAIAYSLSHQEDLTPASVSSHQVNIQCLHSIRYPPPEAAVSQPEVQEAKVSKLKMASELEDILNKVDNVMGKMIINPVDDNVDMFMRLSNVKDDALAYKLHHMTWVYRYEDEMHESLYFQVYSTLKQVYQLDMDAKMSAFQQPRDEDTDIYNKRRSTGLSRTRIEMWFQRRSLRNPVLKLMIL